jgi:ABC-type multidrug transport system ATPase subunit
MLELYNVCKRFRGIVAVDNVSFSARAGQITGYLGPNGSGKSTTISLRMDVSWKCSASIRSKVGSRVMC